MANQSLAPFEVPTSSPYYVIAGPARRVRLRSLAQGDCELGQGVYSITVLISTAVQKDFHNDSEMWKMFLDEVKEEDSRFTDAWKEDANSIIVFVSVNRLVPVFVSMTIFKTGLFSAVVGAFIIEFYKKLSSDSGDQTLALLQQISHQLPNSPNGTNVDKANQPSSGTAMVWVIALWLISLVLSLTCALIATLLQQWARRYVETPKSSNVLRHRARVRSLLLDGTKLYKIPIIVEMLPTLLHFSVYLFLAGLVIAFHTIHKTVAIAVDVGVGVSGLAYLVLSILPCLDVRCPYRTPISQILWYPCHVFPSFAATFLHRCILGLRGRLNEPAQSSEDPVSDHGQYLTDGLEKTIFYRAVTTLRDGDHERVTWLFNQLALGDRHTFLKFAASIPIHKIPNLIPSIESVSFRESLLVLFRIVAGTRPGLATWIDSDVHRRSLLVCLHAICHIAKSPALTFISHLDFVRDHFVDTGLMRALWNDDDKSIRITSCSIRALVAKRVVRSPLRWPQLRNLHWLQEVIGDAPDTDTDTCERMNLKSFIDGVLPDHVPTEDVMTFKDTLAILLDVQPDDNFGFQSRLSAEIQRMREGNSAFSDDVVDKLRSMFPFLLETPATSSTHARSRSSGRAAPTREGSGPMTITDSAPTPAAPAPAVPSPVPSSLAASTPGLLGNFPPPALAQV